MNHLNFVYMKLLVSNLNGQFGDDSYLDGWAANSLNSIWIAGIWSRAIKKKSCVKKRLE